MIVLVSVSMLRYHIGPDVNIFQTDLFLMLSTVLAEYRCSVSVEAVSYLCGYFASVCHRTGRSWAPPPPLQLSRDSAPGTGGWEELGPAVV